MVSRETSPQEEVHRDETAAERQRRQREREALNLSYFQGDAPTSLFVTCVERGYLANGGLANSRARGDAIIKLLSDLLANEKSRRD